MKKLVVCALIVGLLLLSLKYFSAPWIWIFGLVSILIIISAFRAKKQRVKVVLFNLLALPIALLLTETYFLYVSFKEGITRTGTSITEGYSEGNDILGYSPLPGIQRTLKVMRGDDIVFDVTYTIDDNGLRNTPSSNNQSSRCLLFFGGSFTFGAGLEDNETLPYFMGEELNGNYKIFNFGFHGYGPHQMLAAIENGLVDDITTGCQQFDAIYSCIPGHVARTAGYSRWDQHGPKYVKDNDKLVYKGPFDAGEAGLLHYFAKKIEFQLIKSLLFKKLFHERKHETNDDQKDTFIAIVERSQYLLREINNESRFIIVFWDANNSSPSNDKNDCNIIMKKFSEKDFEYYLVTDILDVDKNSRQRYWISPYDKHPNAEANRRLAKYLRKKLESK